MKIKAKSGDDHRIVSIDDIEPDPRNPNNLTADEMERLDLNLKETIAKIGRPPTLIVRKHPKKKGKYMMLDGEHRMDVYRDNNITEIPVDVWDVDDDYAGILLENLNQMRGEPDEAKEAAILSGLLKSGHTKEELGKLLYMDEENITDLIVAYDDNDALKQILDEDKKAISDREEEIGDALDEHVFTELEFTKLSLAQAKVIEAEITRISKKLKGKNTRARALEMMAVMSSQTPIDDIPDADEPKKNGKKKWFDRRRRPKKEDEEVDY